MNRKYLLMLFSSFVIGIIVSLFYLKAGHAKCQSLSLSKLFSESLNEWPTNTKEVEVKSSLDSNVQSFFFLKSTKQNQPLVVSLHTWSESYENYDPISLLTKEKNMNYLRPNFRGPNDNPKACCSDFVIADIDDTIEYAIKYGNVDKSRIYLIGSSGGGYTALCYYFKGKFNSKKVSAWGSVSDLEEWYFQSKIRKTKYHKDILNCCSTDSLQPNLSEMKERSPIHWVNSSSKQNMSDLHLYAGIKDGITGSVPFTHSIFFYNKMVLSVPEGGSEFLVSPQEIVDLFAIPKPQDLGTIGGRKVFLEKRFQNISITIFDGGHEFLENFAINELLEP